MSRFIMSIIYLGSGIFLLVGDNIFNFPDFQKIGLAIILISYGSFRLYRSLKKMKEEKDEENNN